MKQQELWDIIKEEQRKTRKKSPFSFFKDKSERIASRRLVLRDQLAKAGFRSSNSTLVSKIIFIICIVINFVITVYAVNRFYGSFSFNKLFVFLLIVFIWVFVFLAVLFVVWLLFYLTLDLAIFKRKQKLEEVLPDFLQLASSNIRAGMTTDQALWFAVRPRFGVLAKEIEEVAKRTLSGESLDVALRHFVNKYNSKVLARSMNILIEGIRSGGEIGNLLNKIAGNIQEMNLLKKEMSANVTTYVIFITFATVIAAPFLFGLASQLLGIIQEVFGKIDLAPGSGGVNLSLSENALSIADFRIFAVVSLMITSFFSAIIISTIQKGDIKSGIKYIPGFMFSSVILFFIVYKLFNVLIGGMF